MEKQLFENHHPSDRVEMLKDNCDKIEQQSYMKKFTHEEILLMKDNLAEVSIDLNDIAIEKKAVRERFSEREKPLTSQKKGLLQNIKRKAVEVDEECFKFIDQESGEVGYYNCVGDLIFMRPIMPSEQQKTIFNIKSGTSNK